MSEIKWTIDEEDIEWTMQWSKNGSPDRPDEQVFEHGPAVAMLLLNEVIFLNSHWWEKELPKEFQEEISVNVNCNDVFAWGTADAERLPYNEIENLYRMWRKDPQWGAAIWCIKRRNQMPQKPVEDAIREAGIWDIDLLGVAPNTMDAEVTSMFRSICSGKQPKE